MKCFEIYRCHLCGNMVEALNTGTGVLSCCGEPMQLLSEKSVDAAAEKHVPVLIQKETGVVVAVGSIPHPMEADHYIEWIEIHSGGRLQRKYLKPGEAPETDFGCPPSGCISGTARVIRAYCNKHGLWRG